MTWSMVFEVLVILAGAGVYQKVVAGDLRFRRRRPDPLRSARVELQRNITLLSVSQRRLLRKHASNSSSGYHFAASRVWEEAERVDHRIKKLRKELRELS